jgi:uncharacterized protein
MNAGPLGGCRIHGAWLVIRMLMSKRDAIAQLCRRYHVLRLDVFGSAARETDFSESSDIDLLVDYDPSYAPPALDDFFALRDELSDLFGRKVDLTMASAVRNPYLRAAIERSRQPLHGA